MNKRIEGLWWKARIGYNNQNCDPEVLEKFAEKIVQECMDVVAKKCASPTAYQALAEHWGVEL